MKEILEKLERSVIYSLSKKLDQPRQETIPHFGTYDHISLSQYPGVTIGFCLRIDEAHVLLFNSEISVIKENVRNVRATPSHAEKRVKLINPIVFTLSPNERKAFRLHPDRGHFVNASLLTGSFLTAFQAVLKHGQVIVKKNQTQKSKH